MSDSEKSIKPSSAGQPGHAKHGKSGRNRPKSAPHNEASAEKNNSQTRKNTIVRDKPQKGHEIRSASGGRNRKGPKRVSQPSDSSDIKMYRNEYTAHFLQDDGSVSGDSFPLFENGNPDTDPGSCSVVAGRNAVRELLRSDRSVDKIFVRRGDREGSIVVLVAEAVNRHIPVVEADRSKLDQLSGGAVHQGIVALAAEKEYVSVDDILNIAKERGEAPLIAIADGIADPYNLGSLIRCAEGAGAHGLIIPKRRAVGLTSVVSKSSAGAIEHLAIAKVSSISAAVEDLKKKGIWTYAAEAGGTPYYETDFSGPAAIVFGSEGSGIQESVLRKCDFVVSIPMYGKVNSFNVSTAASVILCEAARRHRAK